MTVVLTPIDGSERALEALPWAAALAGAQGRVVVLRVIPPDRALRESRLALTGIGDESGAQRTHDAWTSAAEADLDKAAAILADSGIAADRVVQMGEPDEEIVAAVARQGADLIVMASQGRGAIGRAIFGSVADRVARTSTVPVLVVRAREEDSRSAAINRLVVPLDGSEIAERALPVAVDLARRLGISIHVVRAIDPVTTVPVARGVFGAAPAVNADITDRLWQEAESEAQATVANALSRLQDDGIDTSGAVLTGSPFFAITEFVEPGDLIVLTSHGRGGVRRWLLGSVAEKLVREAPVPVLLVPAAERGAGDRLTG